MDVCTRIDKKIDVSQKPDSIWERECLLFVQASNFVEIDRPFFLSIFNNIAPTVWLISGG